MLRQRNLLSLMLITASFFSGAYSAQSAPRAIGALSASDFYKCQRPDLSPDEIISYCAAMLKMNIKIEPGGPYRYPRQAALANYALHTGLAFQRKGQNDFARRYFNFAMASVTEMLKPFPDDAKLLGERCWLRAVINIELDAALADCEHGLQTKPGDSEALRNKGFVLYRQDKYREALASYDASLQINAEDPYTLFLRGVAKQRLDAGSGDADIKSATDLNQLVPAIFTNYGVSVN